MGLTLVPISGTTRAANNTPVATGNVASQAAAQPVDTFVGRDRQIWQGTPTDNAQTVDAIASEALRSWDVVYPSEQQLAEIKRSIGKREENLLDIRGDYKALLLDGHVFIREPDGTWLMANRGFQP